MEGQHSNDESGTCLGWPSNAIDEDGSYESKGQTIKEKARTVHWLSVGGRGRRGGHFGQSSHGGRYLCRRNGIKVSVPPARLDSLVGPECRTLKIFRVRTGSSTWEAVAVCRSHQLAYLVMSTTSMEIRTHLEPASIALAREMRSLGRCHIGAKGISAFWSFRASNLRR